MKREEILRIAKNHFFLAMLNGWAAGVKATNLINMPGYKEIDFRRNDFRVLDRYCVSEKGKSAGTTTIWYFLEPIWFMSYGGYYHTGDTQFLKRALMAAYKKGKFHGGRGPGFYEEDLMHYENLVDGMGDFSDFRGREEIRRGRDLVGFHKYWGMALI